MIDVITITVTDLVDFLRWPPGGLLCFLCPVAAKKNIVMSVCSLQKAMSFLTTDFCVNLY